MSVVDFARDRARRLARQDRLRDPEAFTSPLHGGIALEVGGPSAVFGPGGGLPLYPVLGRVDGVQFAARTVWHGHMDEGTFDVGDAGRSGHLFIREGGDLSNLDDGAYDLVLSSHVVEHFANPLGALREWLRVLRPGGHLLCVLPHRDGTFDHRRPVTTLDHLLDDERGATGEDDMTHADEVLRLHDLDRDPSARTPAELRERVMDNHANRSLHHHVFVTESVLRLVDHLGLGVRAVEARWPHDIYVLAALPSPDAPTPDNAAVLAPGASWRRASPFRSDRGGARA